MKRTHMFIPEPLLEKLRVLATERDTTVSELIRRAIEDFLKKQK